MSGTPVRVLADAAHLADGQVANFRIVLEGLEREAFALRHGARWLAWENVCRHQSRRLDAGDGALWDARAEQLVCMHHGARYEPGQGRCVEGPCVGSHLTPLALELRGAELWCTGRPPGAAQAARGGAG